MLKPVQQDRDKSSGSPIHDSRTGPCTPPLVQKEGNDPDEDEHDAGDALFVVFDKVGAQ
jgi:hypothetical protein